jgi:hypothetical protein
LGIPFTELAGRGDAARALGYLEVADLGAVERGRLTADWWGGCAHRQEFASNI